MLLSVLHPVIRESTLGVEILITGNGIVVAWRKPR